MIFAEKMTKKMEELADALRITQTEINILESRNKKRTRKYHELKLTNQNIYNDLTKLVHDKWPELMKEDIIFKTGNIVYAKSESNLGFKP